MSKDNFDDEMLEVEAAFQRIVSSGVILTNDIKERLEGALSGGKLPSSAMWKEYFSNNISKLKSIEMFSAFYGLNESQHKDLEKCAYLLEYVQYETIKNKVGWGILTEASVQAIKGSLEAKASKGILEVGCGSGYWSKVLSNRLGIDVQACDINKRTDTPKPKYYKSLVLNAIEAMNRFPNYDILMIWTDPGSVGLDVVNNMKPGQSLIISGNIEVTGSKDFYKNLDIWFDIESHKAAISFSGANERTYILKKRDTPKCENENLKVFESQFVQLKPSMFIGKKKIKFK